MATQGSKSSLNFWPQRRCDCKYRRDCIVRTSGSKKNPDRQYFASTCNDTACNGFVEWVDEFMERNRRSTIPSENATIIAPSEANQVALGSEDRFWTIMEEKDAFYVVRKGDIIGVYKNLSDCQAEAGSSVCNPSTSVYKGYCLPKEAEEYLVSHGLNDATYSISAADVSADMFGKLVACPFQQPASYEGNAFDKYSPPKKLQEVLEKEKVEAFGSTSFLENPQRKHFQVENFIEAQAISTNCRSCLLEFDGASKGNPGLSGAGAVLRAEDGSTVYRLREGVGIATNNVAEYRAVILGLKYALKKGFKHIRVQGDSKLVCMQIQGLWKTKNQNMADLCKIARELKDKFSSFQIDHIVRDFNSEADAQANLAINLRDGQVQEECV